MDQKIWTKILFFFYLEKWKVSPLISIYTSIFIIKKLKNIYYINLNL